MLCSALQQKVFEAIFTVLGDFLLSMATGNFSLAAAGGTGGDAAAVAAPGRVSQAPDGIQPLAGLPKAQSNLDQAGASRTGLDVAGCLRDGPRLARRVHVMYRRALALVT